jgi:hypothetical protein
MSDEIDPAMMQEKTRESVEKIKGFTETLRSVLRREKKIAGDLLEPPVNEEPRS